jgi:hypothetical protein
VQNRLTDSLFSDIDNRGKTNGNNFFANICFHPPLRLRINECQHDKRLTEMIINQKKKENKDHERYEKDES